MKYGQRLEQAMKLRGKTRKELAAAIGCEVQNIGSVLRDYKGTDQKLELESHFKAAKFLKIDPLELLTGEVAEVASGASGFTESARELATIFDLIPRSNIELRARTFSAAALLILDSLPPKPLDMPAPTPDSEK